jgi:hypothetical protein
MEQPNPNLALLLKALGGLITSAAITLLGIFLKEYADKAKQRRNEERRKKIRSQKALVLLDLKQDSILAELEHRIPGFEMSMQRRFENKKSEYDWLNDIHVEPTTNQ